MNFDSTEVRDQSLQDLLRCVEWSSTDCVLDLGGSESDIARFVRPYCKHFTVLEGALDTLPSLEASSLDKVFGFGIFESCSVLNRVHSTLSAVFKALRPGGIFLVATNNPVGLLGQGSYTAGRWVSLFKEAGFEVTKQYALAPHFYCVEHMIEVSSFSSEILSQMRQNNPFICFGSRYTFAKMVYKVLKFFPKVYFALAPSYLFVLRKS